MIAVRKTMPFLSIHGVGDKHMWADKMENFMKSNFDLVEFHKLAGVGHAPFYERPEAVNKYILDFVHKISPQSI
jgi:pimeloyl-ACP methyl ester carboxylesterase